MLLHFLFIKSTEILSENDLKLIDFLSKPWHETYQETRLEQEESELINLVSDQIKIITNGYSTILEDLFEKKNIGILCLLLETFDIFFPIKPIYSLKCLMRINYCIFMDSLLSSSFELENIVFKSEIHKSMFYAYIRLTTLSSVNMDCDIGVKVRNILCTFLESKKKLFDDRLEKYKEISIIFHKANKTNPVSDQNIPGYCKNGHEITCKNLPVNFNEIFVNVHKKFNNCLKNITKKFSKFDSTFPKKIESYIKEFLNDNSSKLFEYQKLIEVKNNLVNKLSCKLIEKKWN